LQNQAGFIFKRGGERFSSNFDINKTALSQLVAEFSKWVRAKTNEHDSITILGI
jgi:ribosomal protein S17E